MLSSEYRLYQRIVDRGHLPVSEISPDDKAVKGLLALGAVRIDTVVNGQSMNLWYRAYFPTDAGEKLCHDYLEGRRHERRATRRYWITTGIAVLALAVSIIALIVSLTRQSI